MQPIAFMSINVSELGVTDVDGVLQHRSKDRLKVTRRRTNDSQHIGSGRLLLQRLPQFV
jgi:hypothetical protein